MEALLKAARERASGVQGAVATAVKATTTAATAAVKTIQSAVPVIAPDGKIPSEQELTLFFKGRSREPEFYTFDPKGNLIVRDGYVKGEKKERGRLAVVSAAPGAIKRTYTIPPYIPIKAEYREELDNKRIDAVRELEEQYETKYAELRELHTRFDSSDETVSKMDILNANAELAQIDAQRHTTMYPVRDLYYKESVPITSVLLSEQFDKGKTFGDNSITLLRRSLYTLDNIYVQPGTEIMPEPPVESESNGTSSGGGSKAQKDASAKDFTTKLGEDLKVILFGQPEENEYGFLSTFYPVEFVVDGIKYFTVEQVLAAEKARLFLDDELRTRIMKTRAPRSMRTMAGGLLMKPSSQTGGMMQIQPHEWEGRIQYDVLRKATYAKFNQHAELKRDLLTTGGAVLGLCDTRERQNGTGLALTDTQAANTSAWKGGNRYGQILMEVRAQLREQERADNEISSGGEGFQDATKSVISGGEYRDRIEEARKGVIIAAAKKRVGFA